MKKVIFFASLAAIASVAFYYYQQEGNEQRFIELQALDEALFHPFPAHQSDVLELENAPKQIEHDQFYDLDQYAQATPKTYETSIASLAQYLIKPAKTDLEKARLLFMWVCTHVKYDDAAYNSNVFPDYTPEYVLKNKKAVCEGYSVILQALCEAAGMQAEKVVGYSKGYSYVPGSKFDESNHAWNIIRIENKWHLFDATWASGYGTKVNGKLVSKSKFDPFWFDVNPKAFIFSHLPEDPVWQFIGGTITLAQFENLPKLSDEFFSLGFPPDKVLSDALTGKVKEFVETWSLDYPIDVSALPYTRFIVTNKEHVFKIRSLYAEKIAIIDGKEWIYFTKNNADFSLKIKPKTKQLKLLVKVNPGDESFQRVLVYNVQTPAPGM